MNPRQEAYERLGGAYDVRVLEPSPPARPTPPWFADDPVAVGERRERPVVAPVTGADATWDELAATDHELRSWCADRWLGGWRPLPPAPDPEAYARTRRVWHALAEHAVAPARHSASGKIGLRFTRGGFGTPFFARDEQVRVEGAEIVVQRGDATAREPITTVAAAARLAGIAPGAPTDVYAPTTPLAPEEPVGVDEPSVVLLGAWFGFAASVLEQLRAEASEDERAATRVQLWPEHFDLAIDLGDGDAGRRGTFGASPGDDAHPEPYLYVIHWAALPPDSFWNDDSFGGASIPFGELTGAADQRGVALTFLRAGRDLLTGR